MSIQMGSKKFAKSRPRRAMAEINVTPMVDVMLVLLVIFMVAAPMLQVGVPVNLPDSEAAALPQETEPPLSITLNAQSEIYLQEVLIPSEELLPKLAAILAERQSDKIYLRADGANTYQDVYNLMGVLSSSGYNNIALVGTPQP